MDLIEEQKKRNIEHRVKKMKERKVKKDWDHSSYPLS